MVNHLSDIQDFRSNLGINYKNTEFVCYIPKFIIFHFHIIVKSCIGNMKRRAHDFNIVHYGLKVQVCQLSAVLMVWIFFAAIRTLLLNLNYHRRIYLIFYIQSFFTTTQDCSVKVIFVQLNLIRHKAIVICRNGNKINSTYTQSARNLRVCPIFWHSYFAL